MINYSGCRGAAVSHGRGGPQHVQRTGPARMTNDIAKIHLCCYLPTQVYTVMTD